MTTYFLKLLLLTTAFLVSRNDDNATPNIQGSWSLKTMEFSGRTIPELSKGMRYEITDRSITVFWMRSIVKRNYTIRADVSPHQIDLFDEAGELLRKGIVKVDREMLVICFGSNENRPMRFETSRDSVDLLLTFVKTESKR